MSERARYHDLRRSADRRSWCAECGAQEPGPLTPCPGRQPATAPAPKSEPFDSGEPIGGPCRRCGLTLADAGHYCAKPPESDGVPDKGHAIKDAQGQSAYGVPDGLPEKWRDAWRCAVADTPLSARVLFALLSDLAAATKRAEGRKHERDSWIARAADLNPNPRCTHGPHPLACADQTDPEGRCLWCGDIEASKKWEQGYVELQQRLTTAHGGHMLPQDAPAVIASLHEDLRRVLARAEAAEAKMARVTEDAADEHTRRLSAEARCKELEALLEAARDGGPFAVNLKLKRERDEAREGRDHHAAHVRRLQAELAVANFAKNRAEAENERWESGFRNIVTIMLGPDVPFEIRDVVEGVRRLKRFASEMAEHDCEYGDGCAPEALRRHGICNGCRARAALAGTEEG